MRVGDSYAILKIVVKQKNTGFSSTAEVLNQRKVDGARKSLHYEFQYYGNYLAEKLDDQPHATLYMKLAKETEGGFIIEHSIHSFVRKATQHLTGVLQGIANQFRPGRCEDQTGNFCRAGFWYVIFPLGVCSLILSVFWEHSIDRVQSVSQVAHEQTAIQIM